MMQNRDKDDSKNEQNQMVWIAISKRKVIIQYLWLKHSTVNKVF